MNPRFQPHPVSRLTADSPFFKPRPFVFPRDPVSPPETMTITDGGPSADSRQAVHEFNGPDSAYHRIHKPSISYQTSGIRDSPARTVHRNYRFFVVVVPPLQLVQEHGQLGHTLSSGPLHRLSQGIILPLFPTMYGQLTAIAKEFNFPSTTGLCLFLHVNENGIVMTPRISDDSWHTLWSHLFESPTTPKSPPIGGRIEFDIDFRQARWYPSWLSTSREQIERPLYVPSTAPSLHHGHYDNLSHKGEHEGSPELGHPSASPWAYPHTAPVSVRHVPRKLSLVERFDNASAQTESRLGDAHSLANPEESLLTLKPLSPIAQVDEPRSASEELQNKVQSWRASAVLKPTPLTNRGQASLEPVNLPNNLSLDQNDFTNNDAEEPLNLADFTWSISSAHPDDDSLILFDTLSDRLPSPDIARRIIDDCPPTPSTATSWGPPSSFPPSPLTDFRAPSLDLAFRAMFSRPLTPATATSWGPRSPAMSMFSDSSRQPSVHLCDRGEFSLPVTPLTATSWGAPFSYPPTPVSPEYVMTPDAAQVSFDHARDTGLRTSRTHPRRHAWPYLCMDTFGAAGDSPSGTGSMQTMLSSVATYPHLVIYPPIYPHFDIYPAPALSHVEGEVFLHSTTIKVAYGAQYPYLQIYDPVYPHNLETIYPPVHNHGSAVSAAGKTQGHSNECHYPIINIYPVVYPHFDLYPAINRAEPLDLSLSFPTASLISKSTYSYVYPHLVIYPSVYPNFNLYPGRAADSSGATDVKTEVPVVVQSSQYGRYPFLIIYPSVYPYLDIYPTTVLHPTSAKGESNECHYPIINIYPAVYPYFDLYPEINRAKSRDLALSLSTASFIPMSTYSNVYPHLVIYPSVYPNFNLYPGKAVDSSRTTDVKTEAPVVVESSQYGRYPFLTIYSSVYPYLDIYPTTELRPTSANEETVEEQISVVSNSRYPIFDLYPAVYPYFNIYPGVTAELESEISVAASISIEANFYPIIRPYPPVYPFFDLYPSLPKSISEVEYSELTEHVFLPQATGYPAFNLYPANYPNFQLYPSMSGIVDKLGLLTPGSFAAVTQPRVRKAHRDLHLEVFGNNPVHTPSGSIITTLPQHSRRARALSRTRSPTGPVFQTPTRPPALPTRNDILPSPLKALDTSGLSRASSHVPRISTISPIQPRSQFSRSHSLRLSENTITRHPPFKPLTESADLASQPADHSDTNSPISSKLSRASSMGHNGRLMNAKSRIRDSFVLHMARAYDNQSLATEND